jgi:hypothetical protein
MTSSRKKSKLKKHQFYPKNPPRQRNIPALSLKKRKALESKVFKRRLREVETSLIAQRSDLNDASTKSRKARSTPHLTCKKVKADKEHERRSSHARNEL